jgi:hypothetical protein
MDYNTYMGIVRALVPVGTALAAKYMDAGVAGELVAALVGLAAAAWSVSTNHPALQPDAVK